MTGSVQHWADLPYREIWAVDTEYYHGPGGAHGGRDGDPVTPLCLVAIELRSERVVRLWQDELGPEPPYSLDPDVLIVSFMATAEFGFHIACGWGQPANAIDAYIEFRHLTNDARVKAGDRPAGYHSLAGALRYFGEDEIDTSHKTDMRGRILAGPPFTNAERAEILGYCEDDTRALARLFRRLVTAIESLPHALYRCRYAWALAQQEHRGVPLNLPTLERIREHWDEIRVELVDAVDQQYGVYEIVDGQAHFRDELFQNYIRRHRIPWPTYPNGALDKTAQTFREMTMAFPQLDNLRELRSTLSQLRLNALAVGRDGRNRTLLGPFGTKTGRNAPSNSKFVFGPAKWIRFLITPPAGMALIHRDYSQQEVRIAAVLSGDRALLAACESGDVYLGIAKRLGMAPADATPESEPDLRKLFKTVVLGIQYGLGGRSLALRTGVSLFEAGEILARLHAEFRVFEEWAANVIDRAGIELRLTTNHGWSVRCYPGTSMRTVRNWPIQSTGAAILHAACVLAERRGIHVVAPVHDALLCEAAVADAADVAIALDRVMRDAAALVLRGYELPTDGDEPILPGQHFFDERGENTWKIVTGLLDNLQVGGKVGRKLAV